MMNKLAGGLIAFFVFVFAQINAQTNYTQTVRGRVFDSESKSPVPGAKLKVITADSVKALQAISDPDGLFEIKNVPVGKHEIVVRMLGYDPRSITITVDSGRETVLEIPLGESFIEKEEVTVVARKKGETINEMATVSAQQFSVEETNRYAGSRMDPARMASNFAGVQGADDSRNDIVVRGNSPLGVVYRVEGIDIPNPSHFAISGSTGGPVSILNNKMLANSDFFMSAFPAEYGNSTAGVFDLKLRNGNNKQHEFTGQFGFLGTELLAEGPLSKSGNSSYLIMGRYSTLSLFKTLGIQIGTDAVPSYSDAAFKLNWRLKKGGTLALYGMGGISNISIIISEQDTYSRELYGEGDRDQYFGTSMGVTGLIYKKTVNEKSFFQHHIAYSMERQYSHHDYLIRHLDTVMENGSEAYKIVLDSLYPLMGYKYRISRLSDYISMNHKMGRNHVLKYGLNTELQMMDMIDSVKDLSHTFWINRWNFKGSGVLLQPFVQWKWRVSENMDFTAGLHAAYYSFSNSVSPFEPRIGWKYRLPKGQAISAGVGVHSQTQPLYIYSYHGDSVQSNPVLYNKNMDFTKSLHTVLGYEKAFTKSLQIKTEAYYQYLYNIPVDRYASAFSLMNMGSGFARFFPDTLVNAGTAYNYGLELTVQKFFDKSFFFLFSASLYDSKYRGSDGVLRSSSYNGTYTVNLLAGKEFKISKRQVLGIGIKTTRAGGRRYGYVNLDETRQKLEIVFSDSLFNERQFRDYFRFDLKVSWKMNTQLVTHEIGLDLVNLFNTRNLLGLAYAPDLADPSAEPIAEKTQLGFLPLFYYKADFRFAGRKKDK